VTAAAIPTFEMPSIRFGSPKDFDRWFWRTYHEAFLEILHRACDPMGQETYLSREIARRRLR
jgi:hypothetical protein